MPSKQTKKLVVPKKLIVKSTVRAGGRPTINHNTKRL